jgi:hypothetical protein
VVFEVVSREVSGLEVELLVVGLERQQVVSLLGILPLEFTTGMVLTRKVHSTPNTQQAEQSWLHTRREQKTCQSIIPEN